MARGDGLAEFPDCVSARALRHLGDLARQVEAGDRAVLLFVIQRTDCDRFAAAADIDPAYAAGLAAAASAGVEVLTYQCAVGREAIRIDRRLPWTGGG